VGANIDGVAILDAIDPVGAWAASGAMALSGRAEAPPLGPPQRLVGGVLAAGATITARTTALGEPIDLDWLALLGERAAHAGLQRHGAVSCGQATRLLPVADGWVAVCLARPDDVDLVPAWLGVDPPSGDPWPAVSGGLLERSGQEVVAQASLLGLPVGLLGERAVLGAGVQATELGAAAPVASLGDVLVVDLSALWAGPLCSSLLGLGGARVVKVESVARPDGARQREDGFFDLLNAGKRSVALDLRTDPGRRDLARLLAAADVVVEAARPRALEQLGLIAADLVGAATGPRLWVSITGHGRSSRRVAFGDDAAVAGGLVVTDGDGPCFCADAVGDPVTALVATAAALDALADGGRWMLDVAMADVCDALAGPTLPAGELAVAPPRSRPVGDQARPLGADTAAVLDEL
jgi:hypothetical protein